MDVADEWSSTKADNGQIFDAASCPACGSIQLFLVKDKPRPCQVCEIARLTAEVVRLQALIRAGFAAPR